jgi:hypothetical protein
MVMMVMVLSAGCSKNVNSTTEESEKYNVIAQKDLRNATAQLETFFVDNRKYPDTFNQTKFEVSDGVKLEYRKLGQDNMNYMLTVYHKKGTIEYNAYGGDKFEILSGPIGSDVSTHRPIITVN